MNIWPFLYHSYGLGWVKLDLLIDSDKELAEASPYWNGALIGRDLLNGVRSNARFNKISVEHYHLNYFG